MLSPAWLFDVTFYVSTLSSCFCFGYFFLAQVSFNGVLKKIRIGFKYYFANIIV